MKALYQLPIDAMPVSLFSTAVSFVTAFTFSLFIQVNRANAIEPQCEMSRGEDRHIDLTLNGRSISLIGWTHTSDTDLDKISEQFYRVSDAAQVGDCAKVQEHLLTALSDLNSNFEESKRVLIRLGLTQAKFQIQSIGVEASANEMKQINSSNYKYEEHFAIMNQTCPQLAQAFGRYKLILAGPDYIFSSAQRPQTRLVGVESDEARKVAFNYRGMQLYAMKKMADRDSRDFTPKAVALAEKLDRDMAEGLPTSDRRITEVLIGIKTRHTRELFQDYFRFYSKITYANLKERNDAIVANILALKENHALVVGSAHLPDLAEKFMAACRSGQVARPVSAATSEPFNYWQGQRRFRAK